MRTLMMILLLSTPALAQNVEVRANVDSDLSGMGSGVCVDPDGYILTAWHLGSFKSAEIKFQGQDWQPAEVVTKRLGGEVIVLRATKTGVYPYYRVGDTQPGVGNRVVMQGFVNGKLITRAATVTKTGSHIVTDVGPIPGMSGGPLLTRQFVVGLVEANQGRGVGLFLSTKEIHEALNVDDRAAIVFCGPNCPPCKVMKADGSRGDYGILPVTFVTDGEGDPRYGELCRKHEIVPTAWPTVYLPHREIGQQIVEGYQTPDQMRRLVRGPQHYERTQGIGIGVFGANGRQPVQRPLTSDQVAAIADSRIDARIAAVRAELGAEQREAIRNALAITPQQTAKLDALDARVAKAEDEAEKAADAVEGQSGLLQGLLGRIEGISPRAASAVDLGTSVGEGIATGTPIGLGLSIMGWLMRRRRTEAPKPE